MPTTEIEAAPVVAVPSILAIIARAHGLFVNVSHKAWSTRIDVEVSEIQRDSRRWVLAFASCAQAVRYLKQLCSCSGGACSNCKAGPVIRDSGCAIVLARRSLSAAGVDLSEILEPRE